MPLLTASWRQLISLPGSLLFPARYREKCSETLHDRARKQRSVLIFAHYSTAPAIDEYVFFYLSEIEKAGFDIVFCSTAAAISGDSLERLRHICTRVVRRPNIGYDIGSYYVGWRSILPGDLANYRNIAFANDSVYGPIGSLDTFCRFIEGMNYDMCGMTDSFERMYHIQSWFLIFKNNEVAVEYLNWFWRRFKFYNHRAIVIAFYELGMTYLAIEYGLKVGAFAPFSKVRRQADIRSEELGYVSHTLCGSVSPMHYYWRILIEDFSAPFLKRELLTVNPRKIPDLVEVKKLAAERGYDIEMITEHDARNRWLR